MMSRTYRFTLVAPMTLKKIAVTILVAVAAFSSGTVFAADPAPATMPEPPNMSKSTWVMDSGGFSPNESQYRDGPKGNLSKLLQRVADLLLIAIATLAVLLIAVAGFRMATSSGNSDEATKGKTMVRFNILAIVVSLMAYTIIQFVSWIISAS